jgi:putative membrane protein
MPCMTCHWPNVRRITHFKKKTTQAMLLKDNIPVSYVLGKIKREVLVVSVYATLVAVMYYNFHFTRISIPMAVPSIVGTVLSLLLAFRSNQAYDRWWEARTLWGAIVNDSRTVARQVWSFSNHLYGSTEEEYFRERFIKRQIAWCYSLGQSLRKLSPLLGVERWLSGEEIEFAKWYASKPVALLELHAADLRTAWQKGWLNDYQQVEIDRTLTRLCDAMGGCERIKNTVFPATYSLYIHFSLILFISLLPFGLIEFFGIMEIPLVIAIASSLLLIEKMAIHLQDPFENKPTDTPMTSIAQTIERDLRQLLEEKHGERETKRSEGVSSEPVTFFIL